MPYLRIRSSEALVWLAGGWFEQATVGGLVAENSVLKWDVTRRGQGVPMIGWYWTRCSLLMPLLFLYKNHIYVYLKIGDFDITTTS